MENCLITEIYQVQGTQFHQKLIELSKTQTQSVSHGDLHAKKSGQYRQAFLKKKNRKPFDRENLLNPKPVISQK